MVIVVDGSSPPSTARPVCGLTQPGLPWVSLLFLLLLATSSPAQPLLGDIQPLSRALGPILLGTEWSPGSVGAHHPTRATSSSITTTEGPWEPPPVPLHPGGSGTEGKENT